MFDSFCTFCQPSQIFIHSVQYGCAAYWGFLNLGMNLQDPEFIRELFEINDAWTYVQNWNI